VTKQVFEWFSFAESMGKKSSGKKKNSTPPILKGLVLVRAAAVWQDEFASQPLDHELNLSERLVLLWLLTNDHAPQQGIGKAIGAHPMVISNTVRQLVHRGLLERKPHALDARKWVVSLSPSGLQLAQHLAEWAALIDKRLESVGFGEKVQRVLQSAF
jgi:DNA-binding MarR family transcriptional regulator